MDLFHFTGCPSIQFHNGRRSLFHIRRIFHFVAQPQIKSHPFGRLFLLAEQDGDSNRFPCNSPVGCCGHQFKNWWQPYFSPVAKRQSNPSSSPTIREVQRGCHSEDAKRPWESVLHSNASNLSISGEYGLPHQSADWFAMTGFLTASAI